MKKWWSNLTEFLASIVKNLLSSFNNMKDGWSARKLSAFAGMLIAAYVTVKIVPVEQSINALYSWQVFILTCLGIITVEQIIILLFNNKPKKNDTTTDTTTRQEPASEQV
jgi:hypothetical protein